MNWEPIDNAGLFMGVFAAGFSGWNLLGAYTDGVIGTRSGSVSRKKSPAFFWIATGVIAFVFGTMGIGMFLVGLGAPPIHSFVLGLAITVAVIVAIAQNSTSRGL